MKYEHDAQQAKELAKAAISRLQRESLRSMPHNFEVLYLYYAELKPELTHAINTIIDSNEPLNEDQLEMLYRKYVSPEHNATAVIHAGDEINSTIQSVSDIVRDTKTITSEYSGKLGDVNEQISDVKDPDELKNILGGVLADTENMLAQNKRLEEQLDQSSEVMQVLKKDLEEIKREAMTDGLTGLANRKAFDQEISQKHKEATQHGEIYSLLMMDIDHFKNFNDHFGHQVGDQVLRLVSRTLVDGVKGRDMAARYGGEEFAIILPDTPLEGAVRVAENLRQTIERKDVINRTSGEILARITISIGAAEFVNGEELESLIERADAALYTAKHNGRNQVARAPSPTQTKAEESA